MTFEMALKFILTIFGSMGFWEFFKFLIASKKKKKSAEQEALLSLLQIQLYPRVEEIYFRGVVGYDEALNLEQLYNSYRRLGGNSTIKSRYELIEKFERVKDEELEAYASGIVRRYVDGGGDPAEVFCERAGKKVMYADVVKEVERKDG